MRLSTIGCLLAFATRATLSAVAPRAVCNADNVLRALRANSAQASPFCSTYTLPPPNQPLPTYVSQYPASRVSSACTCLITQSTTSTSISSTTSSTSSTTPPTPVSTCKTERITNGNFEQKLNNQPVAWQFAGEVHDPSGNGAYTLSTFNDENGNTYGSFFIQNSATGATGTTTIKQSTPALCGGTTYKLTYSSQISITNGSPGRACSVRISLADQQLVYIGPPNGDPPPFTYQVRETTFVYTGTRAGGNVFTVEFSCNAPQGFYKIDDISLRPITFAIVSQARMTTPLSHALMDEAIKVVDGENIPQPQGSQTLNGSVQFPPFSYEPLANAKSIRLLSLQPSNERRVTGSLRSVELDTDLKYLALSYTWEYAYMPTDFPPRGNEYCVSGRDSDESSKSSLFAEDGTLKEDGTTAEDGTIAEDGNDGLSGENEIIIDGQSLSLTPNLYDALLQIQALDLGSEIWIDAICINQDDNSERSAQVNIMEEIYTKASQVIVWLGAEDASTAFCVYLTSMFASIAMRIYSIPQHDWNYYEFRLQGRLSSAGMPITMFDEWWVMLARFLRRTWFGRLWTLQEVALKTDDAIQVFCGSHSIPWTDLITLAEVLGYTRLGDGLLELLPDELSRGGYAIGFIPEVYGDFQNMCRGKKLFELQHEQLWGLTPHIRATGPIKITVIDELLAQLPPAQNMGAVLMFLISRSALFRVSDPRDRVFAVLGIARKIIQQRDCSILQFPVVDYSCSVEEVFYKAFRFIMEATQRPYNLAFVGDVGKRAILNLPSWVPDFTTMIISPLQHTVIKDDKLRFKAAGDTVSPAMRFIEDPRILILNGFLLDTIIQRAEPNVDIVKKGNWEDGARMLLDCPDWYPLTGQPRLEAFWRTIVADQTGIGESPAPEALADSFFQTIRLGFAQRFIPVFHEPDLEDRVRAAMPKMNELAETDTTSRLPSIKSILDDCNAYFDAEAKGFEYGNSVERDARKQSLFLSSKVTMWRRIYRTSKGYLGLGPESLEPGDLVFIIAGSQVPFVLRKVAGKERYRLVGESYIHGMMHGEALRSQDIQWKDLHFE